MSRDFQPEEIEREANHFAMHLLVPDEFLAKEDLSKIDLANDEPLKKLAKKYEVSITVMAIRVHEFKTKAICRLKSSTNK